MNTYDENTILETRKLISKGEYGLTADIKGLEVWFNGEEPDDISDEMIEFALDIVNDYQTNQEKYNMVVLHEVSKYLNEYVSDEDILDQMETPIINVRTELGASLLYGGIQEIGDHMPEVDLTRNLEVRDVSLNG